MVVVPEFGVPLRFVRRLFCCSRLSTYGISLGVAISLPSCGGGRLMIIGVSFPVPLDMLNVYG